MKLANPVIIHAAAAAVLGACSLGSTWISGVGQDQGAIAKDAIVARKTAMGALSDKMDIIEAAITLASQSTSMKATPMPTPSRCC